MAKETTSMLMSSQFINLISNQQLSKGYTLTCVVAGEVFKEVFKLTDEHVLKGEISAEST